MTDILRPSIQDVTAAIKVLFPPRLGRRAACFGPPLRRERIL